MAGLIDTRIRFPQFRAWLCLDDAMEHAHGWWGWDWGNVPAWFGAFWAMVGASFTGVGVVLAATEYRNRGRAARDEAKRERARQANQVSTYFQPLPMNELAQTHPSALTDDQRALTDAQRKTLHLAAIVIHNASEKPIKNVHWQYSPAENRNPQHANNANKRYSAKFIGNIGPGKTHNTGYVLLPGESGPRWTVNFVDDAGIPWRIWTENSTSTLSEVKE